MTLDDLSVNFDHVDQDLLLSDWHWLMGKDKLPVLVTIAGDVFVQDSQEGTIHFLDTLEGVLVPIADDMEEFRSLLNDKQFVVEFFLFHLVAPLIRSGQIPPKGHVFSFEVHPALGGEPVQANLKPADMAVHFSLLGQIFEQIKDLPPGTPITGAQLVDG
jgi:hypothetical protein